jgi:hypothetical protein
MAAAVGRKKKKMRATCHAVAEAHVDGEVEPHELVDAARKSKMMEETEEEEDLGRRRRRRQCGGGFAGLVFGIAIV